MKGMKRKRYAAVVLAGLVMMVLAACQSTKTVVEPQTEEDCLVMGLVELNAKNIPSEAGSWMNGTHRKDIKVMFTDPDGKEVAVTVLRSDGLFMSRKFKAGTYRLTGFYYAIERNNGWVKFPVTLSEPKTYYIKDGVVNNLGFMDWRYDGGTHYSRVSWGINHDFVEQKFMETYPESAWKDYLFQKLY